MAVQRDARGLEAITVGGKWDFDGGGRYNIGVRLLECLAA